MGCEPDPWAKKWLEEQRAKGEKGLTVEKRSDGQHYVIWATTEWVPETKKRKKISEYRGRLMPDGSLVKRKSRTRPKVRSVKQSGNAKVLAKASEGIIGPLKREFPDCWSEVLALAWTRVAATGVLKNAGDEWNMMDDVLDAHPTVNPRSLSSALKEAGADPAAQQRFFSSLPSDVGRQMAVDLSVCFSKARGAFMLKKGYNPQDVAYPQFRTVFVCSADTGRPVSMSAVPGNTKECTLSSTVREMDLSGKVLVMDTGFFSEPLMDDLDSERIDYVVPARRNSLMYDKVKLGREEFVWNGRAIRYGRTEVGSRYWYRFEDPIMRNDERVDSITAGKRADDGNAGNILICSSLFADPEKIYLMYKHREAVEQGFKAGKVNLSMDRVYMQDDDGIRGHLFITFLALRIRTEIALWIQAAGLSSKYSPEDVLRKYASVYVIRSPDLDLDYEVGADVIRLDKEIGLNLYQ